MSLRGCFILEEQQGQQTLNHIEAGLGQYVPLCGKNLDPDDVERVPYEVDDDDWDASHEYFCADCHSVQNRRAVEGNGGALS